MRKKSSKLSTSRRFNPVKAKLESLQECLEQLRDGLPASKTAYIEADRLTHSYVKNCFLMIVQRAVDINNVIIEFSGQTPPPRKYHSFRMIQQNGAIDKEALAFFQIALNCYQKIANPYEELPPSELYDVSGMLLKHGETYTCQISSFFAKGQGKPVGAP